MTLRVIFVLRQLKSEHKNEVIDRNLKLPRLLYAVHPHQVMASGSTETCPPQLRSFVTSNPCHDSTIAAQLKSESS